MRDLRRARLVAAGLGPTLLLAAAATVGCGNGQQQASDGPVDGGAVVDGGGGGTGGADGPAGEGPAGDDRLLPLALGRRWTFDVTASASGKLVCDPSGRFAEVKAVGSEGGEPAYVYQPLCDPTMEVVLVGGGDHLTYHSAVGGGSYLYLDTPVEEGHTWQLQPGGTQFIWHFAGPVTVAAGTFGDCWTRQEVVHPEWTITYCRGVGQVRLAFDEFSAELTARNF